MPRPICVACKTEMRPLQNDFTVELMDETGDSYQLWSGDKWGCHGCGVEVVVGFGYAPVGERFQKDYAERRREAELQCWPRPGMVCPI